MLTHLVEIRPGSSPITSMRAGSSQLHAAFTVALVPPVRACSPAQTPGQMQERMTSRANSFRLKGEEACLQAH